VHLLTRFGGNSSDGFFLKASTLQRFNASTLQRFNPSGIKGWQAVGCFIPSSQAATSGPPTMSADKVPGEKGLI